LKLWAKLLIAAALLGLTAAKPLSAQGQLYSNIAWRYTSAGVFPASGATVTVCTVSATGTPCSPTVTVYQDSGLTTPVVLVNGGLPTCSTNPQIGCLDGLGNFSFYVTPGAYSYTVTGSGLNPYGPIPFGVSCVAGSTCVTTSGNNIFAGNNTFTNIITGSISGNAATATAVTAGGPLSPSNINNIRYIDGTHFAKTAAGINAADADCGAGTPCVIEVTYPGSYTDTVVALSCTHFIQMEAGIYTFAGINLPDSTTAPCISGIAGVGPDLTTAFLANGSNRDLLTDTNFATLTGGTNFWGTFRAVISNLTLDGNKANQTGTSYVLRMYGRGETIQNVVTQNGLSGGRWLEWGGTESDTAPTSDIESLDIGGKSIYNGGNGATLKGPNDFSLIFFKGYQNSAWGIDAFVPIHVSNINTYENTSGGCHMETGAGIQGSDLTCSTATGFGLKEETGTGQLNVSAATFAGGVPLQLNGGGGGTIQGTVGNPAAATTCINTTSIQNFVMNLEFITCPTSLIAFTTDGGDNNIQGVSTSSPSNCYTGTPNASDILSLLTPGCSIKLFGVLTATTTAFATATTAGTCASTTVSVPGAATSMVATTSPASTLGASSWSAFVSSIGTVTVIECAVATSAGGSIAFNVRVQP
jgi:hypothetical protein